MNLQPRTRQIAISVACLFTIAILNIFFCGNWTIYSEELSEKRHNLYLSIIDDNVEQGWWEVGAGGVSARILSPFIIQVLHESVGLRWHVAHMLYDAFFLALSLVFMNELLKTQASATYAFLATLLISALLPLTFADHFYHPWDRAGWFFWIIALIAIQKDKPLLLSMILSVACLNKYDIVAAAGLYFLVYVTRFNWRRITAFTITSITLAAFAFFFFAWTRYKNSMDGTPPPFIDIFEKLAREICSPHKNPFILGFFPILTIIVLGKGKSDRFAITSFFYGLFLLVYLAMQGFNMNEFRAQIGFATLMMPLCVKRLQELFESNATQKPAL